MDTKPEETYTRTQVEFILKLMQHRLEDTGQTTDWLLKQAERDREIAFVARALAYTAVPHDHSPAHVIVSKQAFDKMKQALGLKEDK